MMTHGYVAPLPRHLREPAVIAARSTSVHRIKNHLTPPALIAGLALFVALGGPAQAAKLLDGGDVRNGSLTGKDVRNNSLTGADVRGLKARDFAPGTLAGLSGARGGRWLLVDATGAIVAQSGGFRIAAAYPAMPAPANGNVYIHAGEDLSDNGINATIALQNKVNQDGGGMAGADGGPDANAEFSGEISATMCAITGVVACAPTDVATGQPADNRQTFVVSPRLSDGQRTAGATDSSTGTRKRFYVTISGTSPKTFTNDTRAVALP